MTLLVAGALSAGYLLAALFFARFWRDTRDRLFALFAGAFVLLTVQRVALALAADDHALSTALYGVRLLAFLLILYAVVDKNIGGRKA
ncbi:MAG: hypothetical protein ICV87_02730 [Gemmatimonadetes bacterium]|nr:hypothetical protein [Gemmatimonadota bacterium]